MLGGQRCTLVNGEHGSQLRENISHESVIGRLTTINRLERQEKDRHGLCRSARVSAGN